MNHKIACIANNYKTATVLVVLAAISAVLVTSTVAIESGHTALAANGNKTKENDGISIPTKTQQKQECETAGGTSPITASCTAVSLNNVSNSGGVMSEEHK